MDFIVVIAIIGVFQGAFLAISLFRNYSIKNKHSRLFLGSLILLLCLHFIDSILSYTGEFYSYPHFFAIKDPLILLYGPLLCFYVLSLIKPKFKFRWIQLIHFIPFVIFLIRIFPLYLKSTDYKIRLLDAMYENYTNVRDVNINLIFSAHVLIYIIAAIIFLIREVKKSRSFTDKKKLKNLKIIIVVIIAVLIIFSINILRFFVNFDLETVLWIPLAVSICFFFIAYRSLIIEKVVILEPIDNIKNPRARSEKLINELEALIISKKLFLKKNLTLNELSMMLKEAKRLLHSQTYDRYSLEKISEDSGFNSISSFKRSFKNVVGQTPANFRNNK